MSLAHRYDEFTEPDDMAATEMEADSDADTTLEVYETGYQAGWQDAVSALETENARVSAEFAQNVSDMSFTYQEARHKILEAFKPIIQAIFDRVLPDLRDLSLRSYLADQMAAIADQAGEKLVDLAVAPSEGDWVKTLLDGQKGQPFDLRVDAALGSGQIIFRTSTTEKMIDLDPLFREISAHMETFFDTSFEGKDHG